MSRLLLPRLYIWLGVLTFAAAGAIAVGTPAYPQVPTECPTPLPVCPTPSPGATPTGTPTPNGEDPPPGEETNAPEPQVDETPQGGVAAGPTAPPRGGATQMLVLTATMITAAVAGAVVRRWGNRAQAPEAR